MALYLCRFEIDVMVEADSRDEAEDEAAMRVGDEAENLWGCNGGSTEIRSIAECPPDWLDSIPYGDDRTRSVRQILTEDAEDAAPPRDTQTVDMFSPVDADSPPSAPGKETPRG